MSIVLVDVCDMHTQITMDTDWFYYTTELLFIYSGVMVSPVEAILEDTHESVYPQCFYSGRYRQSKCHIIITFRHLRHL